MFLTTPGALNIITTKILLLLTLCVFSEHVACCANKTITVIFINFTSSEKHQVYFDSKILDYTQS